MDVGVPRVSTVGGDSRFVVSLISLRLRFVAHYCLSSTFCVLLRQVYALITCFALIPDFIRVYLYRFFLFRIGNNLCLPTLLVLIYTFLLLLNLLQNLFDLIHVRTYPHVCISNSKVLLAKAIFFFLLKDNSAIVLLTEKKEQKKSYNVTKHHDKHY